MDYQGRKNTIAAFRHIIANETKGKKVCLAGSAALCVLMCFASSTFWLVRAESANGMDSEWDDFYSVMGITVDTHAFDMCGLFGEVPQEDLIDICGVDMGCLEGGIDTKWHVIFEFQGVVIFFLMISFLLALCGTWQVQLRLCGLLCGICWNCCHFIAMIVTAGYRFSRQGRLCALNDMQSAYEGNDQYMDGWTFKDDGRAILAFWILQLLTISCCCCISLYPMRAPHAHLNRKDTASNQRA